MKETKKIVGIGILTALVIVLQLLASGIKFGPFSITLSLVPIIVGAALYGTGSGAWLGFVFGCIALIDSGAFLAVSIPGTVITCIVKGTLCGVAAAFVYKLVSRLNRTVGVMTAGVVCPVVNTGVFLLGCLVFFLDTVKEWGAGAGYENVGAYFLFGFVGLNFLVEMAVNLLLSTAIVRILNVVAPRMSESN